MLEALQMNLQKIMLINICILIFTWPTRSRISNMHSNIWTLLNQALIKRPLGAHCKLGLCVQFRYPRHLLMKSLDQAYVLGWDDRRAG